MMLLPPFVARKVRDLKDRIDAARESPAAQQVKRIGIVLFAIFVLMFVLMFVQVAQAKALAVLSTEGITVVVTDDPCTLDAVKQYQPFHMTWREKGREFKGCFKIDPALGLVVGYFEDGSVVAMPVQAFKALQAM